MDEATLKLEIIIRKTSLKAEMAYEARVIDREQKYPTFATGTTPAEAARKAVGWHVHDHVRL